MLLNGIPKNKAIFYDLWGTNIEKDLFSCRIRDDFRLLVATGDTIDQAISKMLSFYPSQMKIDLSKYDYNYYLPIFYIILAYYMAKSGYYNKNIIIRALNAIDSEETLFPWVDAIEIDKMGINGWEQAIIEIAGDNAYKVVSLLAEKEIKKEQYQPEKVEMSNLIRSILILDKNCYKKYEMRKQELLRVREILIKRDNKIKKPAVSNVISGAKDMHCFTDLSVGDVLAYRISSGLLKGKYVLLITDDIENWNTIICEDNRLVQKKEFFAIADGLYGNLPPIPQNIIYRVIKTNEDNQALMLIESCLGNEEFNNFKYSKIGKTLSQNFPKYYQTKGLFGEKAFSSLTYEIHRIKDLDEILNEIFISKEFVLNNELQ